MVLGEYEGEGMRPGGTQADISGRELVAVHVVVQETTRKPVQSLAFW
jgi:hypothetical protein